MRTNSEGIGRMAAVLLTLPILAATLAAQQISSLVISGQSGQAKVIQVNGRNYVEVEGLARITNGSIGFSGNQIVLTLPGSGGDVSAAAPPPTSGFSKDFVSAGIEAMSQLREWRAALRSAIQSSWPITESWVGNYRRQAQQALRLAGVAASTDADRNVSPFLTNEFNKMNSLSDKYMQMAKSMTYIDPNSLSSDPIDQSLMACARSLTSMVSSNQFVDDGSCH